MIYALLIICNSSVCALSTFRDAPYATWAECRAVHSHRVQRVLATPRVSAFLHCDGLEEIRTMFPAAYPDPQVAGHD